ncbi:RNA polymerase sigma-70 factor [Fulvivirga ulvae]|uniref:RNA polymerase sigma-70 factor n=1 Tax=Fulvivirga ulvae TaxID=2904245 RepID=UPI001F477ECF|nr:RNA polymerase sigma-70 factor [Fulvivirga ulvae]UII32741.1 RNA polymerase sigma-70 factor [Fulvivirga ulvae]
MTDSKNIATQIRSGDVQAFEGLFRRHYAGMCGYALRYVEGSALAEEMVQDVFLGFWEKRLTLEITGSVEAYLYRSVRNACLNHIKHAKVKHRYAESHISTVVEEENRVSDKVVELELHERIETCVNQLPPERKKIFKMSREEGLKYKEIAGQLGLSVKTVEAQMGKALKFLRENLIEYLPAIAILIQVSIMVKEWLINFFNHE